MSDINILNAIKCGDERALEFVVNKYSRLLWRIVSNILPPKSTQDIEECVADVFIYLWQNPSKYDPQKGELKVWLSVIARSRAINKLKETTQYFTVSLDDALLSEHIEVEGVVISREDAELLIAAVKSLKEPDREIFVRKYFKDEKVSDIAEALNLSVKSVENHLYRTKIKLRNILAI